MRTIVIVGGGFCGTVLATMLLRPPHAVPTRLVLVERGAAVGRGVAFAGRDYPYLLNVPAGRMSANPADPIEFLRFMQRRLPDVDSESIVPREAYGDYIQESLSAARRSAAANVRLEVVRASAKAVHGTPGDGPLRVALDSGATIAGDAVVLAVGNPPPRRLAVAEALGEHPAWVDDPWTMASAARNGERVFLVGAGLTMADAVLAAAARAEDVTFHALSRHGLLPARQAPFRSDAMSGDAKAMLLAASPSPRRMMRAVRTLAAQAEARGGDWREVIGLARGMAPILWQSMSESDRAQFLRHARTFWDIHRHRLPDVARERLAQLQRAGRLHVHAGRITAMQPEAAGVVVRWRPRGQAGECRLLVDRVVNCTGPDYDLTRARDPLLRTLVRDGFAVPDAHGLGLRTGRHGAVIDAAGGPSGALFYLGPMLRAEHWEVTGAAELAAHAAELADHLRQSEISSSSRAFGAAPA